MKRIKEDRIIKFSTKNQEYCQLAVDTGVWSAQAQLEDDRKEIAAKTVPPEVLEATIKLRIDTRVQELFEKIGALFADEDGIHTFIRGRDNKAGVERCKLIIVQEWLDFKKESLG